MDIIYEGVILVNQKSMILDENNILKDLNHHLYAQYLEKALQGSSR